MIFRCRMSDLENKSVPPINHPDSPDPDSYRDYRDRETNKHELPAPQKNKFCYPNHHWFGDWHCY